MCPALSLLGMTTPKELYRACRSRDIANGFLNRFMFVEEKVAPPYQKVAAGALELPERIKAGLQKLYQPPQLLDQSGEPAVRLTWGPGAEEIFDNVRISLERETDERKRELFWRAPEKIVRVATIVAAGRFATEVSREDMEWAWDWVSDCDQTLLTGVNEYMEEEKLEFSELCREVLRRIRHAGGVMTQRELGRSFQGNLRYKRDLTTALEHLVDTEQLHYENKKTGGRPSPYYSLPQEERK
jgi:hypothetical protein